MTAKYLYNRKNFTLPFPWLQGQRWKWFLTLTLILDHLGNNFLHTKLHFCIPSEFKLVSLSFKPFFSCLEYQAFPPCRLRDCNCQSQPYPLNTQPA